MTEEIWKALPGFEGYEISNFGNARSYRKKGVRRGFSKHPKPRKAAKSSTGCMTLVVIAYGESKPCAFKMHRLVYELFVGPIPDGMEIDHIDRNPVNNVLSNLRLANRSQQLGNSRARRAGFKGVFLDKRMSKGTRRWTAMLNIKPKGQYLGAFATEIEAALAYNKAAIKYFGEFACLNKI